MSIRPERSPHELRALARQKRLGSRPPRTIQVVAEATPEVVVEESEPEAPAPVKKAKKKAKKKTTKKKAKKATKKS